MRYLLYSFFVLSLGLSTLCGQNAEVSRGTRHERPKTRGEREQGQSPRTQIGTPSQQGQSLERLTWQKTLYRKLSLDAEANAPLAYPQRPQEGQHNLLSLLFSLLAEGQIRAYEYIDGEEQFSPKYELSFADLLTRFALQYQSPEDSPSELVKAYYVKEQHYFDEARARFGSRVLALCPILYDLGDYGEVPKPLFWVKYSELKPYISEQIVQLSADNEALRGTLADYFDIQLYRGEIIKTQSLTGKSLAELSRDSTELKARQAQIEAEIKAVRQSLSLPDSIVLRSQGQAPKAQSPKRSKSSKSSARSYKGKSSKAPKPAPPTGISARNLS